MECERNQIGDFTPNCNYNYNNYASLSTSTSSSSSSAINSSNIGFQLLKKHGWKEGTGLGVSQQGRLEPVETCVKTNKRGLGAEKLQKKILVSAKTTASIHKETTVKKSKTEKALSKKVKKMMDEETQWQEKEFERSFFREFWPENV